jgi:hypothetical protein
MVNTPGSLGFVLPVAPTSEMVKKKKISWYPRPGVRHPLLEKCVSRNTKHNKMDVRFAVSTSRN